MKTVYSVPSQIVWACHSSLDQLNSAEQLRHESFSYGRFDLCIRQRGTGPRPVSKLTGGGWKDDEMVPEMR